MIRQLQQMALDEGYVEPNALFRWQESQQELFNVLLDRIDALQRHAA